MKRLIKAKYAILLVLFGFGCATALALNIEYFETLSIPLQILIALLISIIGFYLVKKDRTQD